MIQLGEVYTKAYLIRVLLWCHANCRTPLTDLREWLNVAFVLEVKLLLKQSTLSQEICCGEST